MPAEFDTCVKGGGRVRTKSLKDGKYMRICFLNGKSFAGEVKTKEELKPEELKDVYTEENDNVVTFTESLTFGIVENSINEEKRTVRVCALSACVSKNNRYYSPKVVESVLGTLTGKKSFADHDQRDTKNLVGRIIGEEYKSGKIFADVKFSKSTGIAKETFEKIQDGTITDVSIAADGKTKRVKLGEQLVDEVTDLKIHSVDFVTEGGVQDAKVLQVFENLELIPTTKEVEKTMEIKTIDELKKAYPELVEQLEKPSKDKISELETKMVAKEVEEYKESEIVKLKVKEEVKTILRKRVFGKTKEEVSESLKKELDFIEETAKATKGEAKIEGVPDVNRNNNNNNQTTVWTTKRVVEDTRIPENLKVRSSEILVTEGSKVMIEFLKTRDINIT